MGKHDCTTSAYQKTEQRTRQDWIGAQSGCALPIPKFKGTFMLFTLLLDMLQFREGWL